MNAQSIIKVSYHGENCILVGADGKWITGSIRPADVEEIAHRFNAFPALLEALKDLELRACQARLASSIGKKKNRTDFLLAELDRIEKAARVAITQADKGVIQ